MRVRVTQQNAGGVTGKLAALTDGNGVLTDALLSAGILVYNEDEADSLL